MVSRLEVRGKHWFFQKVLREYLDAMAVDSAETVLDLGCRTGVAARTIARRADFSGRVTGIDLSPYLVEAAGGRRRVRWPGRVSLRRYARSRYSRWQIRCRGRPHARESRARGADGAQGSGQGRQTKRTNLRQRRRLRIDDVPPRR